MAKWDPTKVRVVVGAAGWIVSTAILAGHASRPAATLWSILGPWLWAVLFAAAFSTLAVSRQRSHDVRCVMALGAVAVALFVTLSRLPPAVSGTLVFVSLIASVSVHVAEWTDETQRALMLVGLFVLPAVIFVASLTLGQTIARSVFDDEFVEFAQRSRAKGLPTGDDFGVGPYTYSEACVRDDDVLVWRDQDTFLVASAVRIGRDGSVGEVRLREGSPAFACAEQRRL